VAAKNEWIENRPRTGFIHLDVRELWAYRELAGFLAQRDIKTRYKQAVFGVAWAVVQPLALVTVFTLVFRRLANISSDGIPYPVFALVGLMVWGYASGSVARATQSLVGNAALITKVYFPRLLIPTAAIVPGLIDFVLSVPVLTLLCILYDVRPTWAILTLPVWVALLIIVAFMVGVLLSALNVRYRDITQAITLLIQLWLFLSPVAYPSSSVPEPWQDLYYLNPMAGVITGMRWALVGGPNPIPEAGLSVIVTVGVFAVAIVYFQHTERRFADVI
jgi:lipopolysaccharide transport system permease protein